MTAGQKIYNLRERGGLTQTAFAQKIGVNPFTVQNWENGSLPVDANAAAILSKAFCVDPGYFVDDKPFPDSHLFGNEGGVNIYNQPEGFCHDCGLPIYDMRRAGERSESHSRRWYTYKLCGFCKDKEEERKEEQRRRWEAEERKSRRNRWIIAGVVVAVIVILVIIGVVVA